MLRVREMKIKIPKRHFKYVDAMFEVECWRTLGQEAYLANIFKLGMDDILRDLESAGGDFSIFDFPPDMDKNLLRGKQIEIKVPYELSEDENETVERIRKRFKMRRETVLTTFFLQGLFDQWSLLKDTECCENDRRFRKLVNRMPHDLFFEFEVDSL